MPSFGPPYIGEAHFRHRSTRHILQVSTVRHHRRCIRPSLCCGRGSTMAAGGAFVCHRPSIHRRFTVVAFVFRRSSYACALVAPFGDGIGSLHLRLQSFTLRFAPDHSFRLRFRSPMPGERKNGAGTYRNPSPRPPPAIISGRGSRSHALGLLPIRRHPAAARCAHDSLCLSRFCFQRFRMERRHRRFLQHSVGVNRPGAFCPGSDHASALLIVCYCRGSSHRTQGLGTVAAGERSKRCFQWSGLWPGWSRRRTRNGAIPHQSPTSPPTHPIKSRYA